MNDIQSGPRIRKGRLNKMAMDLSQDAFRMKFEQGEE